MFKSLPPEYRELPWSVRKLRGLLKPGETPPMYDAGTETVKTEITEKKENTPSNPVVQPEVIATSNSVSVSGGVAADPKLLKEIQSKLEKLENAISAQYYDEPYLDQDTEEYAGSGIRDKKKPVPVILYFLYLLVGAWALHLIADGILR